MELKRVILATNNHPNYIQFWPVVAPLWRAMGLQPTLALIADEGCSIDTSLGDVIRFAPIPGVAESLQAQTIRLLLPCLFPNDVCLIADIDMLPISRFYFVDGAALCPEDAFLVYRNSSQDWGAPRYPMCYIAAKGEVFASVFDVHNSEEITNTIIEWEKWGYGWNTDELLLYHFLKQWEGKGGHVVSLEHEVQRRIDRASWPSRIDQFNISHYIDCHCPRPYLENRELIDQIAKGAFEQLSKT